MSRKFPKLPPGSKNPFERGLEQGMRTRGLKAEEVKPQDTVGGCGNPGCTYCYPNGKPEYNGLGKGPKPETPPMTREAALRMMEQMNRYPFTPNMESSSAYDEAREAVKEWIIEASPDTGWSKVIGNHAAREALIDAIETPLKHAALYAHYNLRPPKGVLLWGPPGNGKTMFAKAAAGAIAKHYGRAAELILINGSALQSPWVGETEERITAIFTYAREYKKRHGFALTIFIDEADALLPPRGESAMFAVRNVSTFLAEMDGLEDSAAFVILATNRPEQIDEALLRDGRCDRKIKVERPTYNDAREILQNALFHVPIEHEHGVGLLAKEAIDYFVDPTHHIITAQRLLPNGTVEDLRMTLGHILSGAMMVGLASRAKEIAFHRDLRNGTRTGVTLADLTQAVNVVAKENIGIRHEWALREMVEDLDARQNVKTATLN